MIFVIKQLSDRDGQLHIFLKQSELTTLMIDGGQFGMVRWSEIEFYPVEQQNQSSNSDAN